MAQAAVSPMPTHLRSLVHRYLIPFLAATAACLVVGCGPGNEHSSLTVFAAASLSEAFRDIADEFESQNAHVEVKLNFAGSQRLRSQLELGAAADVFASADEAQMTLARKAELLEGNGDPFAAASMAVIASTESDITSIEDIASPGVKLVIAHESVPAGHYAQRLLAALSNAPPGLGSGFADRTLVNVVSKETSVKFVEQKVVLGQADAGIVYHPGAMTAVATGSARELPLPPDAAGVRAIYPIAVMRESDSPELAARFVKFVLSPSAQDILAGYGFDAP